MLGIHDMATGLAPVIGIRGTDIRFSDDIREFKLHVSGNGKRQVRTFLAKFSLNVFVSYFLSCVERIIMYVSFKSASSFTLYCLIP